MSMAFLPLIIGVTWGGGVVQAAHGTPATGLPVLVEEEGEAGANLDVTSVVDEGSAGVWE